jgi:hypothetical protein
MIEELIGKPLDEIATFAYRTDVDLAGYAVTLANGKTILIGDCNPILGVCDDCAHEDRFVIVTAINRVWSRPT